MLYRFSLVIVLLAGFLFSSSCKTKEELLQEEKYKKELEKRANQLSDALSAAGLEGDAASDLVDKIKDIDTELMNFLASDPSNDLRSQRLKEFMERRDGSIRASMTDEQYLAYRKALLEKSRKKAIEKGKPNILPNG